MKRLFLIALFMLNILPAVIDSNIIMAQNTASEGIDFSIEGDDDGTSEQVFIFWIDCPVCHNLFSDEDFLYLVDKVDNHIKKMHPDMTGGGDWLDHSEILSVVDLQDDPGGDGYSYIMDLVDIYDVAYAMPDIYTGSSFIEEYEAFYHSKLNDCNVDVRLVNKFIRSNFQLLNISLSKAKDQYRPFLMLCPGSSEQSGGVKRIFYEVRTYRNLNFSGAYNASYLYIFK
ncbi:MAG: hypothetical protein IJ588_11920 [Prevotella sp.]|nr:hypothetical protein [Prevotella sp.]